MMHGAKHATQHTLVFCEFVNMLGETRYDFSCITMQNKI